MPRTLEEDDLLGYEEFCKRQKEQARLRKLDPLKFFLYHFKIDKCRWSHGKRGAHKDGNCQDYRDKKFGRRNPIIYKYSEKICLTVNPTHRDVPDAFGSPDDCPKGDDCDRCHTFRERWYHPHTYKTKKCHYWMREGKCPHSDRCTCAHGDAEWRYQEDAVWDHEQAVKEFTARQKKRAASASASVVTHRQSLPNASTGAALPNGVGAQRRPSEPVANAAAGARHVHHHHHHHHHHHPQHGDDADAPNGAAVAPHGVGVGAPRPNGVGGGGGMGGSPRVPNGTSMTPTPSMTMATTSRMASHSSASASGPTRPGARSVGASPLVGHGSPLALPPQSFTAALADALSASQAAVAAVTNGVGAPLDFHADGHGSPNMLPYQCRSYARASSSAGSSPEDSTAQDGSLIGNGGGGWKNVGSYSTAKVLARTPPGQSKSPRAVTDSPVIGARSLVDNSQSNSHAALASCGREGNAAAVGMPPSPSLGSRAAADPLFPAPGAGNGPKRPSLTSNDAGSPYITNSIAQLNGGFRSLALQESLVDDNSKFSLDPPRGGGTMGGSAPASLQNRADGDDILLTHHTVSPHLVPSLFDEVNRDELSRGSQPHPALMHARHSAPDASLPAVSLSTSPIATDSLLSASDASSAAATAAAQAQAMRSASTLSASLAEHRSRGGADSAHHQHHQQQQHRRGAFEDHRRSRANASNGSNGDRDGGAFTMGASAASMTPPAPRGTMGDPLVRPELHNRSVSAPFGDDSLFAPPGVDDGPTHALFGSSGFAGFMLPRGGTGEPRGPSNNDGQQQRHSVPTLGLPLSASLDDFRSTHSTEEQDRVLIAPGHRERVDMDIDALLGHMSSQTTGKPKPAPEPSSAAAGAIVSPALDYPQAAPARRSNSFNRAIVPPPVATHPAPPQSADRQQQRQPPMQQERHAQRQRGSLHPHDVGHADMAEPQSRGHHTSRSFSVSQAHGHGHGRDAFGAATHAANVKRSLSLSSAEMERYRMENAAAMFAGGGASTAATNHKTHMQQQQQHLPSRRKSNATAARGASHMQRVAHPHGVNPRANHYSQPHPRHSHAQQQQHMMAHQQHAHHGTVGAPPPPVFAAGGGASPASVPGAPHNVSPPYLHRGALGSSPRTSVTGPVGVPSAGRGGHHRQPPAQHPAAGAHYPPDYAAAQHQYHLAAAAAASRVAPQPPMPHAAAAHSRRSSGYSVCLICRRPSQVSLVSCSHTFCFECAQTFSASRLCPLCANEYSSVQVHAGTQASATVR